ncbi:unnamed protein product [Closterium sp. NIES-53]
MGGCGYGGACGGDDALALIADVWHIVTAAIRDGRTGSASQSSSLRASPSPADPHRSDPPVVALVAAESLPAATGAPTSAPPGHATSAHLRLPRVPPVAGMEFVSAGGGVVRAQYPPLIALDPALSAVDEVLPHLAEGLLPPYVRVSEATLGQLWRLSESLRAILLVQVLAHASLPSLPAESLQDGPRDDCLDAADQLALLLAPVLAAPARGGVGAVSQLDAAVRGLRRYLRAGSGASAIGASTLVVRERGTETMATKPPLLPAPTTAKVDAEILRLPEPGLHVVAPPLSALADQQARAPSVSPPAALPAVTVDVPDSTAGPPAAAPSAPPAGVAPAVVAEGDAEAGSVHHHCRPTPGDGRCRSRSTNRTASIEDVRHIVTAAIRDGRTGSASQSSSLRASPSPADPHRSVPPVVALVAAESLPAATGAPTSAPPGHAVSAHLRLPRVPPVAGMEFVSAGGGVVRAQYPPLVAVDPALSAVDEALPHLAEGLLPPYVRVPEATLGQLWRLSESLLAILLVQVLAHASLPSLPADSLQDGPRDDCLDTADQLALLLAPVLAAPARGGVGAVSQLDAAVRGLRRYLRAGSGASAIGASTLVVREVWRTMQGILHALQADRM